METVSIEPVQESISQSGPHLHFGTMLLMPCPFQYQPHPVAICCVVEQTRRTNKPIRIEFRTLGVRERWFLVLKPYTQKVAFIYLFGNCLKTEQYFLHAEFQHAGFQHMEQSTATSAVCLYSWFVQRCFNFESYMYSATTELWRKELRGH